MPTSIRTGSGSVGEHRSPIGSPPRSGDGVLLEDQTGMALVRRFSDGRRPGTAGHGSGGLEWSTSPGELTVEGVCAEERDVDLTHVRAVFRLSGIAARSVLEKVCALDLSDDMFPAGAAGRTVVAGVVTELVRDDPDGVPSYLLVPSRSFAASLWDAVVDAGAEYGMN